MYSRVYLDAFLTPQICGQTKAGWIENPNIFYTLYHQALFMIGWSMGVMFVTLTMTQHLWLVVTVACSLSHVNHLHCVQSRKPDCKNLWSSRELLLNMFFMRLFRNQKKWPLKKRITSFPSVLFVVFRAWSYSRQRGLVSGNGVGGRKRGTERGWAGEKRKFWAPLCCTVSYDFQSSTVGKGAGEGRGRRGEKGVLISANQHPPSLWLVWTA